MIEFDSNQFNDEEGIKKAVEEVGDGYFDYENEDGYSKTKLTLLNLACIEGNLEMVNILLTYPIINVNKTRGWGGSTPLFNAVKKGHPSIVRRLLEIPNVKVNQAETKYGKKTPLHVAVMRNRPEIVSLLLANSSIDVNQKDQFSRTALHYASGPEQLDVLRQLLTHPAIDVSSTDSGSNMPIHTIISDNNFDNVNVILSHP